MSFIESLKNLFLIALEKLINAQSSNKNSILCKDKYNG